MVGNLIEENNFVFVNLPYIYIYLYNCILISMIELLLIVLGEHGVLSAPKPSLATDLTRTYLQQSKASLTSNTLSRHRSCIQMEKAVNSTLA